MIHAYSELYIDKAMINLGAMLDYGVNTLKYPLDEFYSLFLSSDISKEFERGEANIVVGKSGIELVYELLDSLNMQYERKEQENNYQKSIEYWTGWSLAYYQWKYNISFNNIALFISIDEIANLYTPYHEMDITQFCDKLEEIRLSKKKETNLKKIRKISGKTQRELSESTEIPLRTLQEYEQGKKNINKAQAIYISNLAQVLHCNVQDLLER